MRNLRFALLACLAASACRTDQGTFDCPMPCATRFKCDTSNGMCVPDPLADTDMGTTMPDLAGACPPCVAPTPVCDAAARKCVVCLKDADCPLGNVCKQGMVGNTCTPGCSDDSRCAQGSRCCVNNCVNVQTDNANCGAC